MGELHTLRTEAVEIQHGICETLRHVLELAEKGGLAGLAITVVTDQGYTGTFVPPGRVAATLIGAVNMTLAELVSDAISADNNVSEDEASGDGDLIN